MDVFRRADVDGHGHAGIGQDQRLQLDLAEFSVAFAGLSRLRFIVGQLDIVEGNVALTELRRMSLMKEGKAASDTSSARAILCSP